jgi:hypothetical protein
MTTEAKIARAIFDLIEAHQIRREPIVLAHVEAVVKEVMVGGAHQNLTATEVLARLQSSSTSFPSGAGGVLGGIADKILKSETFQRFAETPGGDIDLMQGDIVVDLKEAAVKSRSDNP